MNTTQNNAIQNSKNKNYSKNTNSDIDKLLIGLSTNDRTTNVFIPTKNRLANTLVLGGKSSGKTSNILPMMLNQDFQNTKCGATIIVSKNEVAYNLYALAKSYKRDVILLKPSINNELSNVFLWKDEYLYDYINENIINYKEVIKKKQIVIIDMELLKHKVDAIKSVAMLLQQLELDMQETDITQKAPHYLYVDDAQYYLPFLEKILYYGDEFNVGVTLFLQSRAQLKRKNMDYSFLIDSNVRNLLFTNFLSDEDVEFYKERFFEYKQSKILYKRNLNELLYEIIDNNGNRRCGLCSISNLMTIDWESIYKKAKLLRTKLLKEKRSEFEKKILASLKSKYNDDYTTTEEEEQNLILNEEEKILISSIEKELSESSPDIYASNSNSLGSVEPIPIDVTLLEDDEKELKVASGVNLTKQVETETVSNNEQNIKDIKKMKEEKIKEILKIREKSIKRNVSTKIFNNYKSDLKYFEEKFDFSFD